MGGGKLSATDDNVGRTVLLIDAHCGQPMDEVDRAAPRLEVCTPQGEKLTELAAIVTHLCSSSHNAEALLGETPEIQAQVLEWLIWATTELSPLLDAKLAKVNAHLESRTYLAGGHQTVADLVIFGVVHPAVAKLPQAQVDQFCNLLRWYDLLQQGAHARTIFAPVHIPKPRFVPPTLPSSSAGAGASAKGAAAKGASAKGTVPEGAVAAPAAGARPAASAASSASTATGVPNGGAPPAAADGKSSGAGGGKKEKKEKKAAAATGPAVGGAAAAAGAGKSAASAGGGEEEVRVDMLDLRVGVITKVERHPNADSLYLEEIDVGEDQPRQVISGLVKFVPQEAMQGRRVVVCCNLKPAKMRDIMSYGMVMCASNAAHDQVDPITPPEGCAPGERITFEGYGSAPLAEINTKKKNTLEKILADLVTDAGGNPVYKGVPFMTSKGPVTATIPNGHVA